MRYIYKRRGWRGGGWGCSGGIRVLIRDNERGKVCGEELVKKGGWREKVGGGKRWQSSEKCRRRKEKN